MDGGKTFYKLEPQKQWSNEAMVLFTSIFKVVHCDRAKSVQIPEMIFSHGFTVLDNKIILLICDSPQFP